VREVVSVDDGEMEAKIKRQGLGERLNPSKDSKNDG